MHGDKDTPEDLLTGKEWGMETVNRAVMRRSLRTSETPGDVDGDADIDKIDTICIGGG